MGDGWANATKTLKNRAFAGPVPENTFGSGYHVVCPRSIRPYHIYRITRVGPPALHLLSAFRFSYKMCSIPTF